MKRSSLFLLTGAGASAILLLLPVNVFASEDGDVQCSSEQVKICSPIGQSEMDCYCAVRTIEMQDTPAEDIACSDPNDDGSCN